MKIKNYKDFIKSFGKLEFSEPWYRGAWHRGTSCQKAVYKNINIVMVTTDNVVNSNVFNMLKYNPEIYFELDIIVQTKDINLFRYFKSFKNIKFVQLPYGAQGYNFIITSRVEKFLWEFINSNLYTDYIRG